MSAKTTTPMVSAGSFEAVAREVGVAYEAMFRFHGVADEEARAMVYAFEGDPTLGPRPASLPQGAPEGPGSAASSTALAAEWLPRVEESIRALGEPVRARLQQTEAAVAAKRDELAELLRRDCALTLAAIARDSADADAAFAQRVALLRRDAALQAASATTVLAPSNS